MERDSLRYFRSNSRPGGESSFPPAQDLAKHEGFRSAGDAFDYLTSPFNADH